MPKVENGIVMYDEFKVLESLKYCSLVEYMTIYGQNSKAIINNKLKRIILNIYNDDILSQRSILKEYDMNSFLLSSRNYIKGEYIISDHEFIRDFEYSIDYNLGRVEIKKLPKSVKRCLTAIKNLTKEERKKFFEYELVEFNKKCFVLYIISKESLLEKGNYLINAKKTYYQESYDIIMQNYYKEIELKQKGVPKTRKNSKIVNGKLHISVKELSNKKADESLQRTEFPKAEAKKGNNNSELSAAKNANQDAKDIIQNKKLQYIGEVFRGSLLTSKGSLEPEKKQRSVLTTTRNMTIVKYLKTLYQDQCQICGETVEISKGEFVSEVHHIQPLGAHDGADVIQNMIVLCPNHHAMFDRGAITIDLDKKIVIHCNSNNPLHNKLIQLKHGISKVYIDYYNENIFLVTAKPVNHKDIAPVVNVPTNNNAQQVYYGNTVTLRDVIE